MAELFSNISAKKEELDQDRQEQRAIDDQPDIDAARNLFIGHAIELDPLLQAHKHVLDRGDLFRSLICLADVATVRPVSFKVLNEAKKHRQKRREILGKNRHYSSFGLNICIRG